jgi:glycosyltransferase involved in cell wall biosynthesis
VQGLDVEVVLAAASPWSKRSSQLDGATLPSNVRIEQLDLHQLRQLYADASLVVVPLVETDFQAGVTTILEAMSMAKAVVCTRTVGQSDIIEDRITGIYVAPADPEAMRSAIVELLDRPVFAAEIGRAARAFVLEHADIERYVARLATLVEQQGGPDAG